MFSENSLLSEDFGWQSRTAMLLDSESMNKLQKAHVFIAGLGGVGAVAAEMLARSGVGELSIADSDTINSSNRNRQIIALKSTEGLKKADVMEVRLKDINPDIIIHKHTSYLKDEKLTLLVSKPYSYIVDAIDTMAPKVFMIYHALEAGNKVVSSMGAGGKFDPTKLQISDLAQSHTCKLASMLRKRLHRLGVYNGVTVVFSTEPINKNYFVVNEPSDNKKTTIGTISYMPALFGCMLASVVIRELVK